MARLTKEERMLFDPSLLIQNQKWKADTIKELMISEGKGGSPNTPTPDWDKDWPKPGTKPRPEDRPNIPTKLANFMGLSGQGTTLSEDEYWRGYDTIMETTIDGSDEQIERLNILWHQFNDQVSNPADGLKIAKTPSQQNATNMRELIKKLTKEGKHIEAQALYREQFPRA